MNRPAPSHPVPGRALWPVVPALRWTADRGFGLEESRVTRALERGAPGFILFGGTAGAARAAAEFFEARTGRPLLLGADLERGAGQQFRGATPLPPAAALGALGDLEVIRAAGELTGREARALGVPWVFAPVGDVALDPENPIVGTRAFGSGVDGVARSVAAWVEGCLAAGAVPCVKHFPGHGRTRTDSHRELPVVDAARSDLEATDLVPFRAGVASGVPTVMTAHVAFPSLDPSGRPATRSSALIRGVLREMLGFDGVVVSDALIMEGAGQGPEAAREALEAGVDLLLYPGEEVDPPPLAGEAARRVEALRASVPSLAGVTPEWGRPEDGARVWRWAVDALLAPGRAPGRSLLQAGEAGAPSVELTVVDDDQGGPYPPPSRDPFVGELRRRGVSVGPGSGASILAVYADPRAWKGRAGLAAQSREAAGRWWSRVSTGGGPALAIVFGGPRIREELDPGMPSLLAWGGESLMQRAAAAWLAESLGGPEARTGNALGPGSDA